MRSFAGSSGPLVEPLLAPEEACPGNPHVLQHDLSRVGRTDPHLLELLAHGESRRLWRDDEARLTTCAELGLDRRNDDVDVRDAAVGDPRLRPVQGPGVAGLVVD